MSTVTAPVVGTVTVTVTMAMAKTMTMTITMTTTITSANTSTTAITGTIAMAMSTAASRIIITFITMGDITLITSTVGVCINGVIVLVTEFIIVVYMIVYGTISSVICVMQDVIIVRNNKDSIIMVIAVDTSIGCNVIGRVIRMGNLDITYAH